MNNKYKENHINKSDFIELSISLHRYSKMTYQDFNNKRLEILNGNFLGKKENDKYILPLKTELVFKNIIGDIKLIYRVNEDTVTFETIEPYDILINYDQQELLRYNKNNKEYTFYNEENKLCKIINTYSKNGRCLFIYTDNTYNKKNKLNIYKGKYDQEKDTIVFKKLDHKEEYFLKEEIKKFN